MQERKIFRKKGGKKGRKTIEKVKIEVENQSRRIRNNLSKFMSIESVMLSNHLMLWFLLLLLSSVFPSTRVFFNESALRIRWPNYWSFSISPSSEYSGLISFRIDWFDLLIVQGTFNLSSNTIQKHQFFRAQFLYVPTFTSIYNNWKNHSFDYTNICQ